MRVRRGGSDRLPVRFGRGKRLREEPMTEDPSCAACGLPTWPDCGYTLAPYFGPARYHEPDEEILLCVECASSPAAVVREHVDRQPTGCCLHIVTDDHNLGDDSVAFVRKWAVDHGHSFCVLVADRIGALPFAERMALFGCEGPREEYDDPKQEEPMTTPTDDPVDSPTITQTVVAFHAALHAMGRAQKEWERRQSESSASALENAAQAVESALGLMVLVVPQGVGQTLSEVDAWRGRRAMMMPGGVLSRSVPE